MWKIYIPLPLGNAQQPRCGYLEPAPPKTAAQPWAAKLGPSGTGTKVRIQPKCRILSLPPTLSRATQGPACSLPPPLCSTCPTTPFHLLLLSQSVCTSPTRSASPSGLRPGVGQRGQCTSVCWPISSQTSTNALYDAFATSGGWHKGFVLAFCRFGFHLQSLRESKERSAIRVSAQ